MHDCDREFRLAFGPVMAGWGSWEWIGADLAKEFGPRGVNFKGWEEPDAEVVVVVKHPPPLEWARRVGRRSALIYCPVDLYGAEDEIAEDEALLRCFDLVVVHCERLRRYFEPLARTAYLDHHVKFAAPLRTRYRCDGNILWVGVRSNLPALVEWVNSHSLPAPLDVLTNPEQPEGSLDPLKFGFRPGVNVRVHRWSPELQQWLTANARAALDIKADDFRSRHKPPAKAIDFVASGVPLALDPESSSAEHLAGLGLVVPSPAEAERWLSREYWAKMRDVGRRLRADLAVEQIARRLERLAAEALAKREPMPTVVVDGASSTTPERSSPMKKRKRPKCHAPKVEPDSPAPVVRTAVSASPARRLFGLLITKDDHEVFGDWCRDQLHLYDAVVCLDGSKSDATERLASQFGNKLVYLRERDFDIPNKTDHGLRRVVHQEIVRRFGYGHWVMCCHTDEFCYHDPRKIAHLAEEGGHDFVPLPEMPAAISL